MTATGNPARPASRPPRVVRVSDGEIAAAQLQVAIDEKLGRKPDPVLVKIANAK